MCKCVFDYTIFFLPKEYDISCSAHNISKSSVIWIYIL